MGSQNQGLKAVCLISGGLDSCVASAWAGRQGYDIYALTFDYGQRHKKEIDAAEKIIKELKAKEHKKISIDLTQIGGSALTDDIDVPTSHTSKEVAARKEIPVTYVPARNTILLSLALGYAEVLDADAIVIGANALDYSGYPDCRPQYMHAFQKVINLATKKTVEKGGITLLTPLIQMSKKEIIELGMQLGAPIHLTWSCYQGGEKACGRCDSCLLRLKGFKEADSYDPIEYER